MPQTIGVPRPELIQVADALAREKSIAREEVFVAMEEAIQRAGRSKYGHENDIRAIIDRRTGEIRIARHLEVVADAATLDDEGRQITLERARRKKPDITVGEILIDPLPPLDFGRVAAQTARQVIFQKVRDAERERQYNAYKDRIGELVSGVVKRIENNNIIIDLGRDEAILKRDQMIPRERFEINEPIRAIIKEVRLESRGPQVICSRTDPALVIALFKQEVPEVYDGIIEIKAVARDPGSRAKMAVTSRDSSIDPIGACIGTRGSRVQAVVGAIAGEKIDIIRWSSDPAQFAIDALAPAEVARVVMDEEKSHILAVIPDDNLSLAIGRRGQNVRLAGQLTGWAIEVVGEAEAAERRQEEFKAYSGLFIEALDVDDLIANLLVSEGFTCIEEIAFAPLGELSDIEGFDEGIAVELQARARCWLEEQEEAQEARRIELGVTDDMANIEALTAAMLVRLGEKNVTTLDDLADLSGDELRDIIGRDALTEDEANSVIMAARAHWFEGDTAV